MSEKRLLGLTTVLLLALAVACNGSSDETGGTTPEPAPNPAPPPPVESSGATGTSSISGSVRFEGAVPVLRPVRMEADPGCAKKHSGDVMPEILVLGENNALANVMVYVTGGLAAGSYAPPSEAAVLDQKGCRYSPHVISVQAGQPFKILNSDGLLHNVHGLPKINTPFNKAMPAAVTEASYVFDKEEVFKIKCDVHPWMEAYVGVVGHPYFDVTAEDGKYEITGLPAGTYEIEVWQEKLKTQTASVTVADGESAAQDFTYSR